MSDETVSTLIEKITRRSNTPLAVGGGKFATTLYDCALLSSADLARLAAQAVGDLEHDRFDAVVGIAYSGVLFAAAVASGRPVVILKHDGALFGPPLAGRRVVIVDDVIHTGAKLAAAQKVVQAGGASVIGYAAIIDRGATLKGRAIGPVWSAYQTEFV